MCENAVLTDLIEDKQEDQGNFEVEIDRSTSNLLPGTSVTKNCEIPVGALTTKNASKKLAFTQFAPNTIQIRAKSKPASRAIMDRRKMLAASQHEPRKNIRIIESNDQGSLSVQHQRGSHDNQLNNFQNVYIDSV